MGHPLSLFVCLLSEAAMTEEIPANYRTEGFLFGWLVGFHFHFLPTTEAPASYVQPALGTSAQMLATELRVGMGSCC
jgi:hypothetical protein